MAEDTKDKLNEVDWEKLKERPKTRSKAEGFVSVYANSMNIEVTFNDFKLFFGEILEATQEKLVTEDRVVILMSPEQTKLVANVLVEQLATYEAVYGPIRKPPGD